MSEKPPSVIPLAYRDKVNAGFVFVCSILVLVGLAAQIVGRFVIGFDGE